MNSKTRPTTVKKMNALQLAEHIVENTQGEGTLEMDAETLVYASQLAALLSISPTQAMLLSVFVDQFNDSRINVHDIANHFRVRPIKVLSYLSDIDALVKANAIIRRCSDDGDVTYRVPNDVIDHLRQNKLPKPKPINDLSTTELMDRLYSCLNKRSSGEISDDDLILDIQVLLEANAKLGICQTFKGLNLDDSDLVLLLAFILHYEREHDDRQGRCDLEDYFPYHVARTHFNMLESGIHTLMLLKLVEYSNANGQIETSYWRLTDYAKEEVLSELHLAANTESRANITRHEDIVAKTLFYPPTVTRQVNELTEMLEEDRMKRIMQSLSDHGMRRGFTCLFYGGPGTGKTETVQQLARMTGRDIMLVDVPSIRSKWVGETEQNIKAVFNRYAKLARSNEKAPILLFNEADALLNRRAEGAVNSVDKMENAMQNIILQEMEHLEGIMIATTNLTGSLDSAFERRFLYKLEFQKPTPAERRHIWQSMLTDLTDADALMLAERFDFSGGQIENIARKRIVSDILACRDTIDLDAIVESCKTESLNKNKVRSHIGFNVAS